MSIEKKKDTFQIVDVDFLRRKRFWKHQYGRTGEKKKSKEKGEKKKNYIKMYTIKIMHLCKMVSLMVLFLIMFSSRLPVVYKR